MDRSDTSLQTLDMRSESQQWWSKGWSPRPGGKLGENVLRGRSWKGPPYNTERLKREEKSENL